MLAPSPWVVQPLVESVRTVGETSVYVFGGRAVSQVDKRPGGDEVRVHEAYGGSSVAVPARPRAGRAGRGRGRRGGRARVAAPAYARVDVMRWEDALGGQRARADRARALPRHRRRPTPSRSPSWWSSCEPAGDAFLTRLGTNCVGAIPRALDIGCDGRHCSVGTLPVTQHRPPRQTGSTAMNHQLRATRVRRTAAAVGVLLTRLRRPRRLRRRRRGLRLQDPPGQRVRQLRLREALRPVREGPPGGQDRRDRRGRPRRSTTPS